MLVWWCEHDVCMCCLFDHTLADRGAL
uniref:LHCA3 n=1 Tax=Arundo donax TaxID=35708 RepID=A0A0A9RKE7_ARUDO